MKITFRKYVEKQSVGIGKVVKVHKIAHAVFILFSCHLRSIKFNAVLPVALHLAHVHLPTKAACDAQRLDSMRTEV
jgi:L-alanine-DL-glutamate epimerase-like enolase superfamily enzyme